MNATWVGLALLLGCSAPATESGAGAVGEAVGGTPGGADLGMGGGAGFGAGGSSAIDTGVTDNAGSGAFAGASGDVGVGVGVGVGAAGGSGSDSGTGGSGNEPGHGGAGQAAGGGTGVSVGGGNVAGGGNAVSVGGGGLAAELFVCPGSGQFATIGEAIAAAPPGAVIRLCAGTFRESLVMDGKPLRIVGSGGQATVIDAGGAGVGIAIRNTGSEAVALEGVVVTGGRSADRGGGLICERSALNVRDSVFIANQADTAGGAIFATHCSVQITGTRFEKNDAWLAGGAVLLVDSEGTISGSQFVNNHADDGGAIDVEEGFLTVKNCDFRMNLGLHGGALRINADGLIENNRFVENRSQWNAGAVWVHMHQPTIRGNTFTGNEAIGMEAGAMYLHQSKALVSDNVFENNRSNDDAGALRIFESSARIERNRFTGNIAVKAGGAIKISHVPSVFVDNEIVGNEAGRVGGGIELDNDGSQWSGGRVADNRANYGGGMHVTLWYQPGSFIEGVRIEANSATVRGGGLVVEKNFNPTSLRRLTVVGNSAETGAGVVINGAEFTLSNSLIAANTATSGAAGLLVEKTPGTVRFVVVSGNRARYASGFWTNSSSVIIENSIFADNPGSGILADSGAAPVWRYNNAFGSTFSGMAPDGAGNLSVDPMFVDPQNGNFRLQPGSPLIDAGNPDTLDADGTRADIGLHGGPGF